MTLSVRSISESSLSICFPTICTLLGFAIHFTTLAFLFSCGVGGRRTTPHRGCGFPVSERLWSILVVQGGGGRGLRWWWWGVNGAWCRCGWWSKRCGITESFLYLLLLRLFLFQIKVRNLFCRFLLDEFGALPEMAEREEEKMMGSLGWVVRYGLSSRPVWTQSGPVHFRSFVGFFWAHNYDLNRSLFRTWW